MTDEDEPDGEEYDADVSRVLDRVRERIEPDADERAHLQAVAQTLKRRAETAATSLCESADVVLVGSAARNTWISGDRDIDVFVRFPPTLERERLETYGLEVGHETLPDGQEQYAEHPYVRGNYEGFDIDVVPCYRLEAATQIQSAVDRTPFHNEYIDTRMDDDLATDVRFTKQFTKAIGVYGSNLRTEGFSGYLVELLVCEYGGFVELLEAGADWTLPVQLDPEDHGRAAFDDPLVVIDPTDPERNVAAVCTVENVVRFQHYARDFLDTPRIDLFEAPSVAPLSERELRGHLERRGTTPIALRFDAPDLVDDQLYPQLRKSLSGITAALEDRGFDVFRGTTFAADTAVIFLELAVAKRPAVERHVGPPVPVRTHAEGFYDAYAETDCYGPFLEGNRYVVERERSFQTVTAFLESDQLFEVGLGSQIEACLRADNELLVGEEITTLCSEFGTDLRAYFEPRP